MKTIGQTDIGALANSHDLFALGQAAIGYAACFDSALADQGLIRNLGREDLERLLS